MAFILKAAHPKTKSDIKRNEFWTTPLKWSVSEQDDKKDNLTILNELIRYDFYSLANSYLNALKVEDKHFLINGKKELEYSFDHDYETL